MLSSNIYSKQLLLVTILIKTELELTSQKKIIIPLIKSVAQF